MNSNQYVSSSSFIFEELISEIERGIEGQNTGLSTGIQPLDELTGGVQKKNYTLIFGPEGSGKSVFTIHSHIMYPIVQHLYQQKNDPNYTKDLKIFFYSLEVDRVNILGKILCWLIYKETKVLYSISYLFSKRLYLINKDVYKLVVSYEKLIKNILDNILFIIDRPMTANQIKVDVVSFAEKRGTVKEITLKDGSKVLKYFPKNPDEHVIIIIDTITNLTVDKTINKNNEHNECNMHSSNCKHIYRNLFHYTVVNVTHSNRDITNVMRTRSGEIYPHKNDISISSYPSRDANIVLCIFAPHEYANENNNLGSFGGYNISRLQGRFRSVGLLKSRDGENMYRFPLLFLGECGWFELLPKTLDKKQYLEIENLKIQEKEFETHQEKADYISKLDIQQYKN